MWPFDRDSSVQSAEKPESTLIRPRFPKYRFCLPRRAQPPLCAPSPHTHILRYLFTTKSSLCICCAFISCPPLFERQSNLSDSSGFVFNEFRLCSALTRLPKTSFGTQTRCVTPSRSPTLLSSRHSSPPTEKIQHRGEVVLVFDLRLGEARSSFLSYHL